MTSTPETAAVAVDSEAALAAVAGRLAAALPPRAFVALTGELGAGKTTFVKAMAAAAGLDPAGIVSPTFGLIHVHDIPGTADRRLVHADLYRLSDAADLGEIGWEDAIAGLGWVFVEWPQRIAPALPRERLDIAIGIDGEQSRTLTFTGRGPAYAAAIAAVRPRSAAEGVRPGG
jgi:tRNA threonylcarbamoyl adenosine modification protein YjeE